MEKYHKDLHQMLKCSSEWVVKKYIYLLPCLILYFSMYVVSVLKFKWWGENLTFEKS